VNSTLYIIGNGFDFELENQSNSNDEHDMHDAIVIVELGIAPEQIDMIRIEDELNGI